MKFSLPFPLKPLVVILATSLPAWAHASPGIAASGAFQIDGNPFQSYLNILPQSGNFEQQATAAPFASGASGDPASVSNIVIGATSDGQGHFGSFITNKVFWGAISPQRAWTQVVVTEQITNTSGNTQNVDFDFNIDQLKFVYSVGTGMASSINTASFSASIVANNQPLWNSSFSASPITDNNGNDAPIHYTSTGTDIGLGNASTNTDCRIFNDSCEFSISNYQQTLHLGPLAANASLEVVYTVNLSTETDTYGGSSSIYFSDPTGLSSIPGAASGSSLHFATPVPEPEMASMLTAGMALLGALTIRRRRKDR